MVTRKIAASLVASLLVAPLLGSCADLACDPGQVLDEGVCVAGPPVVGADAGAPPSDAGFPPAEAFGAACSGDGECASPAAFCAIQPGQTSGVCTATGCVGDASVCPAGWECLDLSIFMAGLPSICTRP